MYLSERCVRLTDLSSRRSQNRSATLGDVLVPRSKTATYGGWSFYTDGPAAWNLLPSYLKNEESFTIFKSRLKTYLCDNCYM